MAVRADQTLHVGGAAKVRLGSWLRNALSGLRGRDAHHGPDWAHVRTPGQTVIPPWSETGTPAAAARDQLIARQTERQWADAIRAMSARRQTIAA